MIIQILICISIYLIIYTIHNNNYVFSKDFTNKMNEILSYDTNFMELYESMKKYIQNIGKEENHSEETQENIQNEAQENINQEAIGGAVENTVETDENKEDITEEIDKGTCLQFRITYFCPDPLSV